VSSGAQRSTQTLACLEGLKRILARLPDGGRALAVGHSPTNEAAVYGLTGERIAPMGKGEGVLVVAEGEHYRVEPLGSGPAA